MILKDIDLIKLSKLTSLQIDQITCPACCKHYIAPETATCGHTLCHSCWRGHRTCPSCAKPFERRNLRHNRPIQNLTEHVQALGEAFEKLFNIELNEFLLDAHESEFENDPTKNVKEWLASSQNHFSAPAQSSEQLSQELEQHPNPLNVSSNKIQIHTNNPKAKSPDTVVHVPVPQDDWDKIDVMPDTEENKKDKENIVGPMDIEPFYFEDNEYTVNNPRRSSRKKELKSTDINTKANENNSLEKQSSKDSSGEIDKKSNKTKQTWNNVKRMRKEFSKLNKKNRNKLNVSIEMCKKTQSAAHTNILPKGSKACSPQVYEIDENTPDHLNREKQVIKVVSKEQNNDIEEESQKPNTNEGVNNQQQISKTTQKISNIDKQNNTQIININNDSSNTNAEIIHSCIDKESAHNVTEKSVKMPFYKKSALHPHCIETKNVETVQHHNIDSNTIATNDDIEITIKVGNTITNIYIKKKNDVELKVNTDREIQTSLGPYDLNEKNYESPQNTKTQNIVINVGDNHTVDVKSQSKTNPKVEELQKATGSIKTVSEKKNTDSADTATAQFEITESVEKELSKVMEHVDITEPIKSKSISNVDENPSKNNKSQKPKTSTDDLEYLNDLDIFDSESIKEADVQLLKNTDHAPSEILLCTVKTKNKTQKQTEKRIRDSNEEEPFRKSKKAKLNDENSMTANETIERNISRQNQQESEPMNYEAIIGTVFANIDAEIEEIRQSQNINKNIDTEKDIELDKSKESQNGPGIETEEEVAIPRKNEISGSVQLDNEFCHQKDSENVFSVCVEKGDNKIDEALTNEKVHLNVPLPNVEEFLTPVISRNLEPAGETVAVGDDVEMVNDDSDKSVVEETPQKTTSFTKLKQKSNDANKEMNQTEKIEVTANVLSDKKSIINLTDSFTGINSVNNVTAVEGADKKTLETPLNINKFVDQIQHKSTPYARKSLNFVSQNVEDLDPEQTLCPTNDEIAKTTQEKEFMIKAFEKTQTTPTVRPLRTRKIGLKNKSYKIAGSCLTVAENTKLKQLCGKHKWIYTDKYSKDLTHLVVGVDEENKSQRSVKYMCALASSIWIVSFQWVEKCLELNSIVSEEYFEALDSTGEPGPMRSRIATKKLFQGITFFCMEPFSVLDVDTLKEISQGMLEAAGGTVVNEAKGVKVNEKTTGPAILLAEPENTQEDRFIFLAMELSIVPVNYEWVLNCLGSYTLDSIQELLLCPASLLPKPTKKWPQELLAHDED